MKHKKTSIYFLIMIGMILLLFAGFWIEMSMEDMLLPLFVLLFVFLFATRRT